MALEMATQMFESSALQKFEQAYDTENIDQMKVHSNLFKADLGIRNSFNKT